MIQQLVEVNLELEGYEVATAGNGEQALAKVADFAPDLIVLDVMMPKLDGREVCKQLKADPATEAIKIIFLSARAQELDVQSGLDLGADAYITKPFDPEELLKMIQKLLGEVR